jgi:hypothetical protein
MIQVFARGRRVAASRGVALVGLGRPVHAVHVDIARGVHETNATARDRIGKTELTTVPHRSSGTARSWAWWW